MQSRCLRLFVCSALILTVPGCGATKEQLGTLAGAGAGILISSQVGGKYKQAAMIGGAILGGLIGNRIGKYLDERDKQRMEEVTQQAIVTGKDQTWDNPENKTRGTAHVVSSQTKEAPIPVRVLKDKVTQVPPLDILGQTYRAVKNADLRGGPGTDYKVVGNLASGKAINVVGKVRASDWYLISEDGVGSGFVEIAALEPAPSEAPQSSGTKVAESDVSEKVVASNRVCRKVEQTVNLADGSSHSDTIDVCQGPNGWGKA